MFSKNRLSFLVRCALIMILLSGTIGTLPGRTNTVVHALGDTPGSLDTTFDGDGLVTTAIGIYNDEARAVGIQPDGKIVVAGRFSNPGYEDFFVIRYNSDGSLDTNFDADGIATTDFGGDDVARALVIQPDGKIVVAGYTSPDGSTADYALARYNPNGSLDTSFDTDGKLITSLGARYDYPFAITIQPDGKIVVVGGKDIAINDYDIAVIRYNPNGSLDTTFDTDGITTTSISNGNDDFGESVAIQPDGKIVVGGTTYNIVTKTDFALVRYNSNGSLDTTFDSDGIVTKDFALDLNYGRGGYVALQSDGKILIAGSTGNNYFLLARYNSNGSPDTGFDTDGFASAFIGGGYATVSGTALQQNGKIILAGYSWVDNDFVVMRYNSDGTIDNGFGTSGKVITDFGNGQDDLVNAVAIQSDGKIVVAGYRYLSGSNYDVALARYIGDKVSQRYYVKSNAIGTNDGSSWTNAYTNLQSALAAVSSGDEIWVAAGTYKPTTGIDRNIFFMLKNEVAIYGGFAGSENVRTQRDPSTNVTVLSGDIGVAGNTTDNSLNVVIGSNLNNSAILDGFTITAGNANGALVSGGGMYNTNSSPTLENLVFINNSAVTSGGGMFNINGSSPKLVNVTFQGNSASSGGAMENEVNSSPSLENVTFANNSADLGGGITNANNCSPTLVNVTFANNTAIYGGGMINRSSTDNPTLTNVTFSHNSASDGSGAIGNAGNTVIRNSILWGNTGGEISNVSAGTATVFNSIIQGGYAGTGNLNADPLLNPLADNGGFTQTMALLPDSPAINAGDDSNCPTTDQRGVIRPQGDHCDIGAYEYEEVISTHPILKSKALIPASLTTQFGTTSGSLSSLGVLDQTGVDDDSAAYVSFQTPDGVYFGYQSFSLPEDAKTKLISTALLQVNFKGPASSTQVWTWSVYDTTSNMWIKIGDSLGAEADQWQSFIFRIRQPSKYVLPGNEIRIQLRSNNADGDAKIDYEALHITYLSIPATPTSVAPVVPSVRPGIFSQPNVVETPKP